MNQPLSEDGTTRSLESAHGLVNSRHEQARARLLQSLPDAATARDGFARWAVRRRVALSGLGLSAAAAGVAMALWLAGPISPTDAMERLAAALDRVNAYAYRMESVDVLQKGEGRKMRHVITGRWRTEPIGLYAKHYIVETRGVNATPGEPKVLVDIEETHRAGARGILIDHLKKQYWWIDFGVSADRIPPGSPQVILYMVRERHGRVLRDLGQKEIDGRAARGLEFLLEGEPLSELGPATFAEEDGPDPKWAWRGLKIEVWLDPETDLPIELHCTRSGEGFKSTYRFTDLEWNVDLPPDAFVAVAPEGYDELEGSPLAEEE